MMNTAQETDLIENKSRTGSEPNITAEMDAASSKDLVDDVSKIETVSETQIMSNVDKPIKKLQRKPHVNRHRRNHITTWASKYDTSRKKFKRIVDETESDSDDDTRNKEDSEGLNSSATKEAIEEPITIETTKEPSTERVSVTMEKVSSTLEGERLKLNQLSAKEGAHVEESFKTEKRKTKESLKDFIERKIGMMERIVENRVERLSGKTWEENVEKHPWLQPIDTWIADRKPNSSYSMTMNYQRDDDPNVASKSTYKCETIKEDEEPQVEGKTSEHSWASRETGSNGFELANSITQLKKQNVVPTFHVEYQDDEVSIDVSNDSTGVGAEAREVKRYNNDLLDKLKDNVKEKMEDIHRVIIHMDTVLHFSAGLRHVYHGSRYYG